VSIDLPSEWRALGEWVASTAGLALTSVQLEQLRTYLATLLVWNRKLALVSQHDPVQIIAKHVADSLFAASRCSDGEAIVDLGSGAGFPGLPIAIARPASRVCLIESRGKKVSFLGEARRAAQIRNAIICDGRIETVAAMPAHRGRYAVATARALTSMSAFLELAGPFLAPGGRALGMRSTEEPLSNSHSAEEIPYQLPDGTRRRLLVVRT